MSGNFLVDTNVLIYSYDRSDQVKQKRAREVLHWLVSTGGGVLSTQILAEFFWTLSRKLSERFPAREAYAQLEKQAHAWRVMSMTPAIVLEGGPWRGALSVGALGCADLGDRQNQSDSKGSQRGFFFWQPN